MNKKSKRKYVLGPEVELLGLKFALGHTSNLTKQSALKKCFLTKSSVALNKLNDLHLAGDVIERKMELMNMPLPEQDFNKLKTQWLENKREVSTKSSPSSSVIFKQSQSKTQSKLNTPGKYTIQINEETSTGFKKILVNNLV